MDSKRRKIVALICNLIVLLFDTSARAEQLEIEALFQELSSPKQEVRREAEKNFSRVFESVLQKNLTEIRTEVLPIIFEALKSQHLDVRRNAAWALGIIAPMRNMKEFERLPKEQRLKWYTEKKAELYDETVPILLALLKDQDTLVRRTAAATLAVMPPQPPEVARDPMLVLLEDPDQEVRAAALATLSLIRPVIPGVIAAIMGVLKKEATSVWEQSTRSDAVRALGNLGATDPRVVPTLRDALSDPNQGIVTEAILALRKLGPPARDVFPQLAEIAKDQKQTPYIRSQALETLRQLGLEAADPLVISTLISLMQSQEAEVRLAALRQLGALGSAARAAIPELQKILSDPSETEEVKKTVRTSLTHIQEDKK
jgi:HEAT repeat protein